MGIRRSWRGVLLKNNRPNDRPAPRDGAKIWKDVENILIDLVALNCR